MRIAFSTSQISSVDPVNVRWLWMTHNFFCLGSLKLGQVDCHVLKDLLKRDAKRADCVCPFCSFHHLIPLLLGLLAEAEALRVEGGMEAYGGLCQFSHF